MLNNNRVRLSDIQMLLAKSKFGQKTYSVIGQGMVEGFLNTSLAERKEFFDEATGVKQYQIKRDESLNKLRLSYENLVQANMLVQEIEPRIKSLTRQVNRLRKRGELEKELLDLQTAYYSVVWHDLDHSFNKANQEYLELEKEKNIKEDKLNKLNLELENFKKESFKENDFDKYQNELSMAQSKRNEFGRAMAKIEAQLEIKLEAEGHFDLAFMHSKKEEIKRERETIKNEIENLEQQIAKEKPQRAELDRKRSELDKVIASLNKSVREARQYAPREDEGDIKKQLAVISKKIKELQAETDIEAIRAIVLQIEKEIEKAVDMAEGKKEQAPEPDENWSKLHKELEAISKEKDALLGEISDNQLRISARSERVKLLAEKIAHLDSDEATIEAKIKKYSGVTTNADIEKEQAELSAKISGQDEVIKKIKDELNKLSQKEEAKRAKLFELQKDLQTLQNEINSLNNRLQAIKIYSTRHETKLEDLEIEIRAELGGLSIIKKNPRGELDNLPEAKAKIKNLKQQLEQIGGIDPAVEDEYAKTKERYDFLEGQTTDLTKTINSLEKVIKELDLVIREKFDNEFKLIAKKFEEYFKILFNGGTAKISKVLEEADEKKEDGSEALIVSKAVAENTDLKKLKFLQKHNATGLAGIEIKATPPGKKIDSVAMLSGGERALTSIALICAIISSNPSPFVVLDEVDAALDEANSERLASILDELSHKTQFIVITHNRASMRKAKLLYGVTMGDDGVSKLLSVKLDEVKMKQ
jgi:chromosome segregation protein